jgi:hypothetical protein
MVVTMSIQIPRVRLIFKVLVLGRDIALQTGFLTQVSGNSISTQLFSTLGVSLGIARPDEDDEFAVALQLWTIPVDERVAGLSKSFTKGYSAAIAVIRPHDLYTAQEIFHELSLPFDSKAFILVVGDCEEVLKAHSEANCVLEESIQLLQINSATEVMTHISRSLAEKGKSSGPPHIYYLLDDALCPIFEPRMQESPGTVCSDDEIDKIREILIEQGFTVAGDACTIRMHEGLASVSLRTGSVKLQPEICRFCVLNCKRNANVCIIAVDSGWSSQ